MIKVRIPTPLQKITKGKQVVELEISNISLKEFIEKLEEEFPGIKERLLSEDGALRRFINFYVNDEDIRFLDDENTILKDGDVLSIIPAIAGGALEFSDDQIERYSRQIILSEVGGKGQKKLLSARVLIVGAGGLGSPVALYLASAGVGTLGIVDSDKVELNNLQRQIIHRTGTVGFPKTESAEKTLRELNPDVKIITYNLRSDSQNALDIIKDYDIVVDGSDNFPTRYLINDACVFLDKPLSHGAILRFDGQIFTIVPHQTPCYRCFFESPPPPGFVPSCQEAGILGAVAGIIGTLQANEVLKLIMGIGNPLLGRILIFDALNTEFREVKIPKNPECPVCGEKPTITELIDYEEFCNMKRDK
ncbi:molybdopterin-synthase adenylyltransferase MoeB [Candidatus Poribacteria bacterium]|nr:molybdopterin-synthase adenylyltransferase MoeB [Candidatus Poribacteria bacterium]